MTLIYNGSITEGAKSITGQKKKKSRKMCQPLSRYEA